MPKLTSAVDQTLDSSTKVVLVTMDNHLSGAFDQVAQKLMTSASLRFKMHAASDWRNNPSALEKCREDISQADIVIVTMLFMEDHFLPILDALEKRRFDCDAMVCIMSAPQVMHLSRMGKYVANTQTGGLIGLLKKLRPSAKDAQGKDKPVSAGAKQMAMLRRLPKLLRFIPGSAQDIRIFFLVMQYWLAGSEANILNMVIMLVQRYARIQETHAAHSVKLHTPVEYPEVGIYHPRMKTRLSDQLADLPYAKNSKQPAVGMLLLRSYLLAGNTDHYDAVIEAIEAKEKIVVYADYDCDGIPGAVIMNDLFNKISYENFSIYIPDRHDEGYGLNKEAIEKFIEEVDDWTEKMNNIGKSAKDFFLSCLYDEKSILFNIKRPIVVIFFTIL